MAAGGAVTRPTPFDLVFVPLAADLAALRDAAARVGRDPRRREDFARVPEVQRLLERLADPQVISEHPEAGADYLALLYAAYRFAEAGHRVLHPPRAGLEAALNGPPVSHAPEVPNGACYLQLPTPWIWARPDPAGPHEPLDGCFVAAAPRGDEVTIVAVLGLRPERGGFTQITLHATPADFLAGSAERRTPPFAPRMEGGGAAGFRSVETTAELLTLVQLALAVAAR